MMGNFISRCASSVLSLILALQLGAPLPSAFAGGNTTSVDVMTLGSKNVRQGGAPNDTPEYLNSLCQRIAEATSGSVGPDAALKLTQKYDLESECKSQSKLPDAVKTYCTLYDVAKHSQVKAYCDARDLAIKAKKGTDIAYKLDIAAAGTCWAEYLAAKSAESSGIVGGVAKAASLAKGKVCGSASMAASVSEIGTTIAMVLKKKGDKVTADGEVKKASDLEKIGGAILQMGISGIGALSGIRYGACLLFNKCDRFQEGGRSGSSSNNANQQASNGNPSPQDPTKTTSTTTTTSAAHTTTNVTQAEVKASGDKIKETSVLHGTPQTTGTGGAAVNVASQPTQPKIDWGKIDPRSQTPGEHKGGASVDGLHGETSNMIYAPLLSSVLSSVVKKAMTGDSGAGGHENSAGNGAGGSHPGVSASHSESNVASTGHGDSGDDIMTEKTTVMMKSAMTFTVLAGLRYMARNSAKKTQENAESFLTSMISSAPALSNIPPLPRDGGGYSAGRGYAGGPSGVDGDQSGLTGTPEEILAPRGSPQREAFNQVAEQIPDSLLDSTSGPGGISGAIGQVASALGADGKQVAAYADESSSRSLAALGMSDDVYATSGGSSPGKKSGGDAVKLNLAALGGDTQDAKSHETSQLNFRSPASTCGGGIYHKGCGESMFEIISKRINKHPISKTDSK